MKIHWRRNSALWRRWTGKVEADGAVTCTFRQGDVTLPCSMRDVSPPPALASH